MLREYLSGVRTVILDSAHLQPNKEQIAAVRNLLEGSSVRFMLVRDRSIVHPDWSDAIPDYVTVYGLLGSVEREAGAPPWLAAVRAECAEALGRVVPMPPEEEDARIVRAFVERWLRTGEVKMEDGFGVQGGFASVREAEDLASKHVPDEVRREVIRPRVGRRKRLCEAANSRVLEIRAGQVEGWWNGQSLRGTLCVEFAGSKSRAQQTDQAEAIEAAWMAAEAGAAVILVVENEERLKGDSLFSPVLSCDSAHPDLVERLQQLRRNARVRVLTGEKATLSAVQKEVRRMMSNDAFAQSINRIRIAYVDHSDEEGRCDGAAGKEIAPGDLAALAMSVQLAKPPPANGEERSALFYNNACYSRESTRKWLQSFPPKAPVCGISTAARRSVSYGGFYVRNGDGTFFAPRSAAGIVMGQVVGLFAKADDTIADTVAKANGLTWDGGQGVYQGCRFECHGAGHLRHADFYPCGVFRRAAHPYDYVGDSPGNEFEVDWACFDGVEGLCVAPDAVLNEYAGEASASSARQMRVKVVKKSGRLSERMLRFPLASYGRVPLEFSPLTIGLVGWAQRRFEDVRAAGQLRVLNEYVGQSTARLEAVKKWLLGEEVDLAAVRP